MSWAISIFTLNNISLWTNINNIRFRLAPPGKQFHTDWPQTAAVHRKKFLISCYKLCLQLLRHSRPSQCNIGNSDTLDANGTVLSCDFKVQDCMKIELFFEAREIGNASLQMYAPRIPRIMKLSAGTVTSDTQLNLMWCRKLFAQLEMKFR